MKPNAKVVVGALLIWIILVFIGASGCAVRRPFAKAQLIVPNDCIVSIEKQPDTECRQNADGTGRMLCYNLKLTKKVGCERVVPPGAPKPKDSVLHTESGVSQP